MNCNHNNGKDNSTLHDDLDQIGRDYGHLEQQEPPELINQAVVNSAHRAVKKKSGRMQFGWLHGLTTTAVIVLALSVILQQRETSPVLNDSIGTSAPAPLKDSKATDQTSIQSLPEPRDSEVRIDTARQKLSLPASPVITEEESTAPEKIRSRIPPAAETTGITQQDVVEFRGDNDKREITLKPASDDETDAVAEETSHETAGTTNQARTQKSYDTPAEQLARIIALKEAGDESWRSELQAFKQRYPDYPIPQGLEP